MNIPTTLKCICGIALGVFLVTNALHLNAYAWKGNQEVSISPSCSPKSGLSVLMNGDGFGAGSILSWKLVDTDGNTALKGYFYANSNGKVKDETSIDDVKKGHYKLYFGVDTNNDGEMDSEIGHSDITIPCQNK